MPSACTDDQLKKIAQDDPLLGEAIKQFAALLVVSQADGKLNGTYEIKIEGRSVSYARRDYLGTVKVPDPQ